MDGQLLATLLMIFLAVVFLCMTAYQRFTGKAASCSSGCGGCNKPEQADGGLQTDITLKLRKQRARA
ncbi:MAG: hypothetical protein U0796_06995 [Gemmatales bacterium]